MLRIHINSNMYILVLEENLKIYHMVHVHLLSLHFIFYKFIFFSKQTVLITYKMSETAQVNKCVTTVSRSVDIDLARSQLFMSGFIKIGRFYHINKEVIYEQIKSRNVCGISPEKMNFATSNIVICLTLLLSYSKYHYISLC